MWDILGIEPTTDPRAIKRAYAAALRIYHPESNQEGFLKLRSAYESALKLAKQTSSDVESLNVESNEVLVATKEGFLSEFTEFSELRFLGDDSLLNAELQIEYQKLTLKLPSLIQEGKAAKADSWSAVFSDPVLKNLRYREQFLIDVVRALEDRVTLSVELTGETYLLICKFYSDNTDLDFWDDLSEAQELFVLELIDLYERHNSFKNLDNSASAWLRRVGWALFIPKGRLARLPYVGLIFMLVIFTTTIDSRFERFVETRQGDALAQDPVISSLVKIENALLQERLTVKESDNVEFIVDLNQATRSVDDVEAERLLSEIRKQRRDRVVTVREYVRSKSLPAWLQLPLVTFLLYLYICLLVKRFMDAGNSVWILLIAFIPFIGLLLLLAYSLKASAPVNSWGPPIGPLTTFGLRRAICRTLIDHKFYRKEKM